MQKENNFNYSLQKQKYLFDNLASSLAGNLAVVVLVYFTLQDIISSFNLNIWLTLHVVITFFRVSLLVVYKKIIIDKSNLHYYCRFFFLGVFLSGLLWGLGAFMIFPQESEYQMFLILMIGGLISGAAVSLASKSEIFYTYFAISMLPYMYVLLINTSAISSSIYISLLFFMLFLTLIERKISKNVKKNILLAFENKNLVSQLEQKIELVNRSSEAKSKFLSVMSHEIRTPMNAIIGFIKLLLHSEKDETKLKYLNTIDKSSYLLLNILNDILDLSKIESGKFTLEKSTFNPTEEISVIYNLFEQICKEKNINLINSISADLPCCIDSDKLRLKQIISNLLSNAVKFTSENKTIELIVNFNKENSSLYVEVRDEGIGIEKESIEKILEEFVQADDSTSRKYGGTGLGLSITNKLLQLFDSKLQIESEVDVGSSFSFEIYVEISTCTNDIVCVDGENSYRYNTIDFKNKKVLVAEDNKTNQMLIEILLQEMYLDVTLANDGLEAQRLFESNSYDIVLMDINMPNKNGIEALHTIREYEKDSKIKTPVVALTANAVGGDKEKYINEGFDDYLAKPLDNEELVIVLKKYIS